MLFLTDKVHHLLTQSSVVHLWHTVVQFCKQQVSSPSSKFVTLYKPISNIHLHAWSKLLPAIYNWITCVACSASWKTQTLPICPCKDTGVPQTLSCVPAGIVCTDAPWARFGFSSSPRFRGKLGWIGLANAESCTWSKTTLFCPPEAILQYVNGWSREKPITRLPLQICTSCVLILTKNY